MPITPSLAQKVRELSGERWQSLAEFAVLKNKLDGWQARRARVVSSNLECRQRERASDDAFLQSEGLSGDPKSEEADVTLRKVFCVLADLTSVTKQSAPAGKSLR